MQCRQLIASFIFTVALCACVRADSAAFFKESQKNEDDAKARAMAEVLAQEAPAASKGDVKKKSRLCFKRESMGEMVCPN